MLRRPGWFPVTCGCFGFLGIEPAPRFLNKGRSPWITVNEFGGISGGGLKSDAGLERAPGRGPESASAGHRATLPWALPPPRELPFLELFPPKPHGQSLLAEASGGVGSSVTFPVSSFLPQFFPSRFRQFAFMCLVSWI